MSSDFKSWTLYIHPWHCYSYVLCTYKSQCVCIHLAYQYMNSNLYVLTSPTRYAFTFVYTYNLAVKHQYIFIVAFICKIVRVLHNLVTRLLQSCWFYTILFNVHNRAETTDPDDPLMWIVIWVWSGSDPV